MEVRRAERNRQSVIEYVAAQVSALLSSFRWQSIYGRCAVPQMAVLLPRFTGDSLTLYPPLPIPLCLFSCPVPSPAPSSPAPPSPAPPSSAPPPSAPSSKSLCYPSLPFRPPSHRISLSVPHNLRPPDPPRIPPGSVFLPIPFSESSHRSKRTSMRGAAGGRRRSRRSRLWLIIFTAGRR